MMRITLAHQWCRLLGLALLTVGLVVLILNILPPAPPETGIAIRSGMFALLGAIFMCVRSGVMLDRQRQDIFGTKTTRLMADEVEEVEVTQARRGIYGGYATFGGGTSRVVIRSDRGSIELGAALSNPEEVTWLRDVLVHVLTTFCRRSR